jgi:pimeloyl-ACP methyl ester carboxylesterase
MKCRALACAVAFALATPWSAGAEPIQVKPGEMRLNGNLELPPGRSVSDGVALVVHGTLSHYGQETIAALQSNLKDQGVATLAITLSLGIDDRKGPRTCEMPHAYTMTDIGGEFDRWIEWLQLNGARSIDVIGFSRGGAQAAVMAAQRKSLRRVVLLAPAFATSAELEESYARTFEQPLKPVLDAARAAPQETRPVDFLLCRRAPVTGAAFVDAYREIPPEIAASLPQSLLVVIAGNDEIVPDLDKKLPPTVRRVVIEDSDHFFKDLYGEDAADAIAEFLAEP